jgi:tRNA(Ile)-lysidine synthase
MTRSDILDYLRQRGQPFREDATNAAADRTRNRIRRRVLPMLEAELNPNTRAALARFATLARWMDEFLDDFATRTLDAAIREEADGRCVLDADALARQPPIIRVAVALRALQRLGAREQRLRFEHLCGLAGLMTADRTRRQVELPGRLSAVAARGRITLSRTSARRATPAARPTSRYA